MAAEVVDPPVTTDPPAKTTPPAKTNFGKVFADALETERTKEKVTPPAKKEEQKTAQPTDKDKAAAPAPAPSKPSILDTVLEDGKPQASQTTAEPDDTEKVIQELEAITTPKGEHWNRAKATMRRQFVDKTKLATDLAHAKEQLGKVDPRLAETVKAITEERDLTKAENAKLLDAITAINVRYSPEYQDKYVKGREKLVERVVGKVKSYGGDVDGFNEALTLSGKRRTEALKAALSDVDDMDRPGILAVLDQIQALDDEASDVEKNPQQSFEKLEQTRRAAQEKTAAEVEQVRKAELDKVKISLPDKHRLFRKVDPASEGATEWNGPIDTAFETANRLHTNGATMSETMEIAVKGARYDFVEKLLLDTRAELREKNKRLAEFEAASPDFKGSSKPPVEKDTRTPGQKYHDALAAEQGGDDEV